MISSKKLSLILVSILVVFFLSPGLVFSQVFGKEKPLKPGLELSQEQKEKIRSLLNLLTLEAKNNISNITLQIHHDFEI